MILGAVGLIAVAVTAFFRWRDDKRTPFILEFDPDDPECDDVIGPWQQLRVRVTHRDHRVFKGCELSFGLTMEATVISFISA